MKIVDVCGFYSETGGGVRSYVHHKLEAAARAGHQLTIIAPGAEDRVQPMLGGKIIWLAGEPMPFDDNYRLFGSSRRVWRVIDGEAPDVLEGSSPWKSGRLAAEWPGRAIRALIFHQDFVAGYPYTALGGLLSLKSIDAVFAAYWRYVRRLSERFDVTVAGGEWLAERLAGFLVHNPVAVPFGVESRRFSPARRDEGLRRALLAACGVPPEGRLLLAVGRFHPEKRQTTLIDAFALARQARGDLGLVLVGDGMHRGAVERRAAGVGQVHLAGAVTDRDQLASIYASADALIHGSAAETYGLVVAEAISSGLAVVTPDAGGAADLARRGRSRTYATGNAKACAAAILDLLARLDRGGEGLDPTQSPPGSAEDHFTALFALYQTLIDEPRRMGSKVK